MMSRITFLRSFGKSVSSGVADNLRGGWATYNDLATQTVLFDVVGGALPVKIPNDGDGSSTNETYLPVGVTQLYNTTTEQIDFSGLSVGDMFDISLDLEVTTTANNQQVDVHAVFAAGSPSELDTVILQRSRKTSGTINFFGQANLAVTNSDVKNFPTELRISSDSDCTVKVIGYFIRAIIIGS